MTDLLRDGPEEACGIFGVFARGHAVAHLTYDGLFALQHRGQESAGMAVGDGTAIVVRKDTGLVSHVFDERDLAGLHGHVAIGHTRYSTTGASDARNAQPFFRAGDNRRPGFAVGHNGNLTNVAQLRAALGLTPDGEASDSELIAELVEREFRAVEGAEHDRGPRRDRPSLEAALGQALPALEGAFSLVVMDEDHLLAARDPNGFRPLCLGRLDNGWVVASETAALDVVGAVFVRELEPGEIVVVGDSGVRSLHPFPEHRIDPRLCVFEFVYFARDDALLYGREVHGARMRMGELLAASDDVDGDLVIGVPVTALPAAEGYARARGLPYGQGLVQNRYIGRTFIAPTQDQRERSARRKFNPLRENIAGKRLIVIEDSVVRGTNSRAVVEMLRSAGATEVHLRVMSPPYRWPCYFGMDTGTAEELLASSLDVDAMRGFLGVDSLKHLDVDSLLAAVAIPGAGFCDACLTGNYPVPVPVDVDLTRSRDRSDAPSVSDRVSYRR